MTKEEQRIAIAKVCGWKQNDYPHKMAEDMWYHPNITEESYVDTEDLPDYLNDLNAMHEAEKQLPSSGSEARICDYAKQLSEIQDRTHPQGDWWTYTHATAAQRAEAFLRTLNLWKD